MNNFFINLITDWGADQFQDVVAETATFTLKKTIEKNDKIRVDFFRLSEKLKESIKSQADFLNNYEYIFSLNVDNSQRELLEKLNIILLHWRNM